MLEDDTMIASGILYALETEGYETNHATGIKDARSVMDEYFPIVAEDSYVEQGYTVSLQC